MSDLLIRGGRVLVPARGIDAVLDVRVRDGVVTEIGTALEPAGGRVIDAGD